MAIVYIGYGGGKNSELSIVGIHPWPLGLSLPPSAPLSLGEAGDVMRSDETISQWATMCVEMAWIIMV